MAIDMLIARGTTPALLVLVFAGEARTWRCKLIDRYSRQGIVIGEAQVLTLTVREDLDSEAVALELDSELLGGIAIADQVAAPGDFTITVDDAQTAALEITEHVWDLWLDDEVIVAPSRFDVALSVGQP